MIKEGTPHITRPEAVLMRNLDSMMDHENCIDSAMEVLLGELSQNNNTIVNRRLAYGMAALACDYFDYTSIEVGGEEFARFYEAHKRKPETKRDKAREILKKYFEREIKS
jgi:hypothetical protein